MFFIYSTWFEDFYAHCRNSPVYFMGCGPRLCKLFCLIICTCYLFLFKYFWIPKHVWFHIREYKLGLLFFIVSFFPIYFLNKKKTSAYLIETLQNHLRDRTKQSYRRKSCSVITNMIKEKVNTQEQFYSSYSTNSGLEGIQPISAVVPYAELHTGCVCSRARWWFPFCSELSGVDRHCFISSPVNGSSDTTTENKMHLLSQTCNSAQYFHFIHSGFTLANGVNLSKPASYNPFYFSIKCGYRIYLTYPPRLLKIKGETPVNLPCKLYRE